MDAEPAYRYRGRGGLRLVVVAGASKTESEVDFFGETTPTAAPGLQKNERGLQGHFRTCAPRPFHGRGFERGQKGRAARAASITKSAGSGEPDHGYPESALRNITKSGHPLEILGL